MPTFTGTHREFKILIDALGMPMGVTKVDRGTAESLRERLKHLISAQSHAPVVGTRYSPLKSNWPSSIVMKDKKHNGWFRKPREVASKVPLNNSTTQEKIDKILEGLL